MKSKEIREFRKTYTKYEKECVFEGYKLAVLFDEKDDVKRYGAKWNQEEKVWWMPVEKLLNEVHDNGTLVRDWLNDNEMIVGQYGDFNDNSHNRNLLDDENKDYTEYELHNSHCELQFTVQFFFKQDVAKFTPSATARDPHYLTIEDGRKRWDELVKEGYNRVENS